MTEFRQLWREMARRPFVERYRILTELEVIECGLDELTNEHLVEAGKVIRDNAMLTARLKVALFPAQAWPETLLPMIRARGRAAGNHTDPDLPTGDHALVVFSGGLDSYVLLLSARQAFSKVTAINFNYGQRHAREIESARHLAGVLLVELIEVDVPVLGTSASALTSDRAVPHGHYAKDTMAATVVPNRNMVMLALAVSKAIQIGAEAVLYGAHAGDHAIYADCRTAFVEAMAAAVLEADDARIKLIAPFVQLMKSDIAQLGATFEDALLGYTWSCYEGGEAHCGNCGTCVERREAFRDAGVRDPTTYLPTARPLEELLEDR